MAALPVAALPFIHKWVAVMPDVHAGLGATVGSVFACKKAVIPAAVWVDIGWRANDRGAWGDVPAHHAAAWAELDDGYQQILARHPRAALAMRVNQLGTLGTGVVHRPRQGQPGELHEPQPRRRPVDEPHQGQAALHARRPCRGDRGASSAARTPT